MRKIALLILLLLPASGGAAFWNFVPTGGGGAFTPASISGLTLWFDAQNSGSVHETLGLVSQWDDLSGNSNHATQATGVIQPILNATAINGHPAITTQAATGQRLALTSALTNQTALTICVVAYQNGGGSLQSWLATTTLRFFDVNGNTLALDDNSAQERAWNYTMNATPSLVCMVSGADPTAATAYQNGSALSVAGTTGASAWSISITTLLAQSGGGNQAVGGVGEMVVYNTSISGADRALLKTYLSTKWGTP